jgi:hypothetical protein
LRPWRNQVEDILNVMHIIARRALRELWETHPDADKEYDRIDARRI